MRVKAFAAAAGVLLGSLVLVLGSTSTAEAISVTVTTTEDVVDAGDGLTSLREAVAQVNVPSVGVETIHLDEDATYELSICGPANSQEDANADGDLDVTEDEQVSFSGDATIVQTCPGERVIDSHSAASQLAIARAAVTGGTTPGNGGGVRVAGNLFLSLGASLRGNTAEFGQGGGASVDGDVIVTQASVVDNVGGNIGGGVQADGSVDLNYATIAGNRSDLIGGGVDSGENVNVDSATVTQNLSTVGGGISATGAVAVNTSTVIANTGNPANVEAGGALTYARSILALGSGGPDCDGGTVTSGGLNVGQDASCGTDAAGDLDDVHPMLSTLRSTRPETGSGFTFTQVRRTVAPSPAIDHDPGCTSPFDSDQNGDPRPAVAATPCDVGAVELTALPCTQQFDDVGPGNQFFDEVCWLQQMRITGGFPDGGFHPTTAVTRQSMAAFLHRLAGSPPVPELFEAPFDDVGLAHPFAVEITWLADTGIAEGYDDGTFRSGSPVSRQAMSAFLHRVAGSPNIVVLAPPFPDVPLSHPFVDEITWLADSGITGGYGDGTFKPASSVSRQAMAAFLLRLAEDVPVRGL